MANQEANQEMDQKGTDTTFFLLDVTNEEQVSQVIEQTVAKFGKLDSIVNNSGIYRRTQLSDLHHTIMR